MKNSTILRALFSIPILSIIISTSLLAQSSTIVVTPSDTIVPFDITVGNNLNFPLQQAYPIGDINADGFMDMGFCNHVGDDRTEELSDATVKSVIITEPGTNGNALVVYDDLVKGIGDVNNDGYDDVLEIYSKQIVFGSSDGLTDSNISLKYPDKYTDMLFTGDINGDGIPEYCLTGGLDTSVYFYSGVDTTPTILSTEDFSFYLYFGSDDCDYASYDYDEDGQTELCIATSSNIDHDRMFIFLNLDVENHEFNIEYIKSMAFLHEVEYCFPHSLADINGDGLLDACHFFYKNENEEGGPGFDLEVFFGKQGAPYFESSVEVSLGHPPNRTAYFCGDVNGDGCEDVCGNYSNDSIAIYRGGENVADDGFSHFYLANANLNDNKTLKLKTFGFGYNEYDLFFMDYKKLDYDHDGLNDLFFNYWQYDDNQRIETIGTAIVLGGVLNTSEPIVMGRPQNIAFSDLNFGEKLENIGDFNNDGFDDWAALAVSGSYLNVYFGASILDDEPDIRFLLPQKNMSKCFDWSHGDINGDGVDDFIISNSSDWTSSFSNYMDIYSNVFIFFGNTDMHGTYFYDDADIVLHDNGTFKKYGHSVGVVGDYNADGFDDIVVGGTGIYGNNRIALMYFGSNDNIGPEPDIVLPMPCNDCWNPFPDPITRCGDINGDGYDDFTLGDDNCGPGRSLVYLGSPEASNQPSTIIMNPFPGRSFGLNTSKQAGDINWDGYPDLVHYSYFKKTIYFYYGGPDFDSIADRTILDTTLPIYLSTVDYIHSLTNDGFSDLLVSDYDNGSSNYRIYSGGKDANNDIKYVLKNNVALVGRSVASGDFNNDGSMEIYGGISQEKNYGWHKGGIIFLYKPYLTGIGEDQFIEQLELKTYPNPASSNLTVEIINTDNKTVMASIYDITGKQILYDRIVLDNNNSNKITIPLDKLNNGIYILKVQQSSKNSYCKFVVQK
ncbi:MAG: T9SS type A sorting domain-containing protein [Chlorobi bacterium]|nr:T9SS type A sorting domain-containing protein [Chlorobiota bacterium]